ncbi:MAG: molybdopterin-dependent oxidoreductase [Halothiobacillaceae bacterium]|nr:molybdopterin-dependent oxidoreductase [Halothiobacillaceae bacterium]
MDSVRTTCPYCGVGCGVLAERQAPDGEWSVRGDPDHPANLGRLCSKGAALAETLDLPQRLIEPTLRGADGTLETTDWETALERVATGFRETIAAHGSGSVAFYVSGQLLTEDYYLANKLMKGYIGAANIDTNSRLCMSSAVAAYKRAFGSDTVPVSYRDLEQADLVVLIGSNTAWAHPVVFQRLIAAKEARPEMRFVVIDPRRTATCDIADLHLPIAPGTDILLLNGLLAHLADRGRIDRSFVEAHVEGFDATVEAARHDSQDIENIAQRCGLPVDDIQRFYDWFTATKRSVSLWSQGLNQSASGTDKGNAVINLHLATGRIGKPGMGPFSITGQPNAMGGREVGGLANQLAAHQDFTPADIDRVGRFWQAPNMATEPGLKAVDLFEAMRDGRIKAVWIMATNPAFSLPDSTTVREALDACPLVVLSECHGGTDTARFADVLLPASTWGERDGTVTNSERCISRQRAFLDAPGQARPDWWIVSQVARRIDPSWATAFDFPDSASVFREYARQTAFENAGSRDLDLAGLTELSRDDYQALAPTRWPVQAGRDGERETIDLFADGRFFTDDRRARMIPVDNRGAASALTPAFPLRLNTGRLRDQWHGMTRTGPVPRLNTHRGEPTVSVHPFDAARYRLRGGQIARIGNAQGEILARVSLDDEQRRGSLFVPMHWSHLTASCSGVNQVIASDTDPVSGQPEFKTQAVWAEPYAAHWYGWALVREGAARQPALDEWPGDYRVVIQGAGLQRLELAGIDAPADWIAWAQTELAPPADTARQWIEFADPKGGQYRVACLAEGRLQSVLFVSRRSRRPDIGWLTDLFSHAPLSDQDQADLLAGKPATPGEDRGPIVCACFDVGQNTLIDAIDTQQITDARQLGECTQAGTNCGSCIPELKQLIARRLTETSN